MKLMIGIDIKMFFFLLIAKPSRKPHDAEACRACCLVLDGFPKAVSRYFASCNGFCDLLFLTVFYATFLFVESLCLSDVVVDCVNPTCHGSVVVKLAVREVAVVDVVHHLFSSLFGRIGEFSAQKSSLFRSWCA